MSSRSSPPEHADCLAALGEPIAEFRVGKARLLLLAGLSVGAMLVGVAISLAWLWAFLFDPLFRNAPLVAHVAMHVAIIAVFVGLVLARPQNRQLARAFHVFHLIGVGLLYLLTSSTGWQRLRQNRGLRVFAFPAGLARVQDEAVDVVRWEEIATITRAVLWEPEQESPLDGAIRFTLLTNDGRVYLFDELLPGLRDLRRYVERYTLPHLFPPALDAWEEGREVPFGKLSANRVGLTCDRLVLPWALCGSVEVVKGMLVVKRSRAWIAFCKIPLREVPNVHVLLALAEYVRKYSSRRDP
jgi:hypothetical protein